MTSSVLQDSMRERVGQADVIATGVAAAIVAIVIIEPPAELALGVLFAFVVWCRKIVQPRALGLLVVVFVLAVYAPHRLGPEQAPEINGSISGVATLVADPKPGHFSSRALADLGGHRVQLEAATGLQDRLAGDQVFVVGVGADVPEEFSWLRRHGVVAIVQVDAVPWWRPGSAASHLANRLRRTLSRGAQSLSADQQSLFAGFVLGDDRYQRDIVADDFRAAGLGHLLAVSGSNVAFLLALLAPFVARLQFRVRVPIVLIALLFFALVTRAEPSVLRATVMAGTAAVLAGIGRPASGRRVLAGSVAGLVLIAPGLATTLGFQLSVLAAAGIVWLSPAIATIVPGPPPLANAIAVTSAAQLAVAPLLVSVFGGVPIAAFPANLAAGPAAGPISAWGLTGGVVAGFVGGPVATVLHLPTRLLIGWVQLVARVGARSSLGEITAVSLVLLALAALCHAAGIRRWVLAVVVGVVLIGPGIGARSNQDSLALGSGVEVWRSGGATVVLVGRDARPAPALEAVRRANVVGIGALVLGSSHPAARDTARALAERYQPHIQWSLGAPGFGLAAPPGSVATVGQLELRIVHGDEEIEAVVSGGS